MADSLRLQVLLDGVDRLSGPLKQIMGGANGLKKAMQGANVALGAMKRQSGDISSYQRLRAEMRGVERDLLAARERAAGSAPILANLRNSHHALAGEVKAARASLKMQAGELAKADKPSQALTLAYAQQQRTLAELEKRYNLSATTLRNANRTVREGEQAANKLARQQQDLAGKLDAVRQRLDRAGISTSQMATRQRAMRDEIAQANRSLEQQRQRLERVTAIQQRAKAIHGAGMTAALHGAGFAAVGQQATGTALAPVRAFAEQQTAATELRAAMMGANGQVSASYVRINALAEDLGNKLPGTTAELLSMMTMLKRQGMSNQVILGGLGKTAAYLGAQLKMPYVEAAEFSAKLQDATRTTEADMLKLGDTIQRAFYLGVDSDNMLQGFVKLSPAMDILHVQGLEATKVFSPLLVMMDQMGMKGEQSGNALRKVFQGAMGGGVQKANEVLAAGGSKVRFDFTDGKGEFGGLDKMFKQLEKFKTLTTQQRLDVMGIMFGDDSETLTTLNAMMNKGVAGYQDVQRKMAAQADLQTRVNASLGTLAALWEAASGTFINGLASVGKAMEPDIRALIDLITRASDTFVNFADTHPRIAAGLGKLALGFAVAATAIGGLLTVGGMAAMGFSQIYKAVGLIANSGALTSITSGLSNVGRLLPMLANGARALLPLLGGISLPVLAIGAAIAVVATLVWKYWGPIKAFMVGVWEGLRAAFAPVMDQMRAALAPLAPAWAAISNAVQPVVQWIKQLFTPFQATGQQLQNATSYGRTFGQILSSVILAPVKLGIGLFNLLSGSIAGIGTVIGTLAGFAVVQFQGMWDIVAGLFTGNFDRVVAGFRTLWTNIDTLLSGWPSKFVQWGSDMLQGLISGLLAKFPSVGGALVNGIKGQVKWFKDFLGIKSPSRLFAQFGDYTMQGYANGLDRSGRAPMQAITGVGQRMRAAGAGLALAATAPVMAAGGGGHATPGGSATAAAGAATTHLYEIHINAAPGMNPGEIARAVAAELDRRERQRGAVARSRLSDID